MVYVIAAYTITLGFLALYGVLLQHRVRVFNADEDARTSGSVGELHRRFNVGAALLAPLWMWGHGLRWPGAGLLMLCLSMLPLYDLGLWVPLLLVAMVPFAAGAALGFVGDRIAMSHRGVERLAEFSTSQYQWATTGVVIYSFVFPWLWYILVSGEAF